MRKYAEKAYAKLNISLDIGKRRDDGYHSMKMVMQTVSLCDDVELELTEDGIISATTNLPYIPGDDRNLAVKAVKKYFEAVGITGKGAVISLKKNVPVGAGMGGGSSDAAAALRAVNAACGRPMDKEALLKVAAQVGSDVAFCVEGGTALAEGRGEILTPLPDFPDCTFVICKPKFSVSTPELFASFDRIRAHVHPDTDGIITALGSAQLGDICRRMYNVFEDVDDRRMKTVAEIKGKLLDSGAIGAVMTGTGSAVFGVFESGSAAAEAAALELKAEYGFGCTAVPAGKLDI